MSQAGYWEQMQSTVTPPPASTTQATAAGSRGPTIEQIKAAGTGDGGGDLSA